MREDYLEMEDLDPADDEEVLSLIFLLSSRRYADTFVVDVERVLKTKYLSYNDLMLDQSKVIYEGFEVVRTYDGDDAMRYTDILGKQHAFYPFSMVVKYLKIAAQHYLEDYPEDFDKLSAIFQEVGEALTLPNDTIA